MPWSLDENRAHLRHMRTHFFAVAVLVAACSSEDAPGACKPREGSYVLKLTERSGGCGDLGEQVVNLKPDAKQELPDGCTNTSSEAPDHCSVTADITCPIPDQKKYPGGTLTYRGKVNWNADASSGTGVLQVIFGGGTALDCSGTYDATYRRQ